MVYSGSDVSFETDSAGTIGLKYTWGSGSDNLLAIEDEAGNHYYATTDRLGSIRTLAKRDGTWLLTRRWDPYGNEISRDSSASFTWGRRLRYGWTGREYDVELGMYYHRARYYSQSLRRFIQEDPVEGSTSPYAYVHGSPLEATDPSGMMDSYEMRMTDPRWDYYAHGGGTQQSATFNGVSISPMAAAGIPQDAIASEGYSSLPSGMGLTPWDMMTGSQQKAAWNTYEGAFKSFGTGNTDDRLTSALSGAEGLTFAQYSKVRVSIDQYIGFGDDLLGSYGALIMSRLQKRGEIFVNDSYLTSVQGLVGNRQIVARTIPGTTATVMSSWALRQANIFIANNLVHEAMHAYHRWDIDFGPRGECRVWNRANELTGFVPSSAPAGC
jgi:RHS repeat-associated protein